MVQTGIKTQGMYTDVNINTQRAGLPANTNKVLFLTSDTKVMTQPVAIYDEADADDKIAANSAMSKMIKAAVKTNRLIDAYGLTLQMDTAQVPAVDLVLVYLVGLVEAPAVDLELVDPVGRHFPVEVHGVRVVVVYAGIVSERRIDRVSGGGVAAG